MNSCNWSISVSGSYFCNFIRLATLIYANDRSSSSKVGPAGIAHLRAFCACDLLHFRTYRKLFVKLDTPFRGPFTFDVDTPKVIVFGIKVLRRNINLDVVVADNVLLATNKIEFDLQVFSA